MIGVVPIALQSAPPEALVSLAEQAGPFGAVAAILWWRIDKLESRITRRVDRLEDDVDSNAAAIYDNVLPHRDGEKID